MKIEQKRNLQLKKKLKGKDFFEVIRERDVKGVSYFIELGESVHQKNESGRTPLHEALVGFCSMDIISQLVNHGADVNAIGSFGASPLIMATVDLYKGSLGAMTLLLENGADLNITTDAGITALYFAVERDKEKELKLLLRYGADPNIFPPDSNPAVYEAVYMDRWEILRLLLKNGADPNVKSLNGESPLDRAKRIAEADYEDPESRAKAREAVRILKQHGAVSE